LIETKYLNGIFDWTKGTELIRIGKQKYTINAHYTIYVNHPKKTLKGEFAKKQGGL
jgi:predicted transcriptional regulator